MQIWCHIICLSETSVIVPILCSRIYGQHLTVIVSLHQEGDEETAAKMQDLALAEGALPRHLHMAMFTQSTDRRLLMNRFEYITFYH